MLGQKTFATALALTIGAAAMVSTADASHKRYHRHHGHHGDAAVAGILGFGIGTLFGSAIASPRYYEPAPRVYYQPAPVVGGYGLVPWTAEWYAYCDNRYRSFNPKTGYFLGYDGQYHFCR